MRSARSNGDRGLLTRAWVTVALVVAAGLAAAPAAAGELTPAPTDAKAIAARVLDAMGGAEAWASTRHARWAFFGGRVHHWDRQTGDIRIEAPARVEDGEVVRPAFTVLMNIHSKQGRAWEDGTPVEDPEKLAEYLSSGHEIWVNDSYWMFMPYKLLDPGVTLRALGRRAMEDGREADVLEMTFGDGVGYTPHNKYEVFVALDSGLIEQWNFYADAADEEPRFAMPWHGWKSFGRIRLATDHGRGRDWAIAVFDELPRSVYESPEPISD